jgi:hypothetical protein
MSYLFVADGECYFTLQYNGDILDTATGLDSWIIQPPIEYPRYLYFNRGYTGLVDGVTLTGGTSGAVIKVGHVVLTGGALSGTTGAGVIFFRPVSGTIASGETLTSSGTLAYAVSKPFDSPVGAKARSLFIQVETNTIRVAMGGATPTNSADTGEANFGFPVYANENLMISGFQNVESYKAIHAVSTSNAVVNLNVYY